MITNQKALEILKGLLDQIPKLKQQSSSSQEYKTWIYDTRAAIKSIFGRNSPHEEEFTAIIKSLKYRSKIKKISGTTVPRIESLSPFQDALDDTAAFIKSMMNEIELYRKEDLDSTIPGGKQLKVDISEIFQLLNQIEEEIKNYETNSKFFDLPTFGGRISRNLNQSLSDINKNYPNDIKITELESLPKYECHQGHTNINTIITKAKGLIQDLRRILRINYEEEQVNKFKDLVKRSRGRTLSYWRVTEILGIVPSKTLMENILYKANISDAYKIYQKNGEEYIKFLEISTEIENNKSTQKGELPVEYSVEEIITNIFNKFHLIAELLRKRKEDRSRFEIRDESDVHFLLYPLLRLNFDSVKHEEYLPDFAGKNPKIDFFIPDNTGLEVKMVRDSKHSKTIIDEISADKDLYRKYSRLKVLYFFVYDPEGYIRDRISFVKDLEGNKPDEFEIMKVIVKPDE